MTKMVTAGIAQKLQDIFQDLIPIYADTVEQGVVKPCCFIRLVQKKQNPMIGRRSKLTQQFQVCYVPLDTCDLIAIYDSAEKIADAVKFITVSDGLMRGSDIAWEVKENRAVVTVSYNCFLITEDDTEKMQTITACTAVKPESLI